MRIERLVMRLARENDRGFERIENELLKLGHTISHETVGAILRRCVSRLHQNATPRQVGAT